MCQSPERDDKQILTMMNEEVRDRERRLEPEDGVICTHEKDTKHYGKVGTVDEIKDRKFSSGERVIRIDYEGVNGISSDRASHIEIFRKNPLCETCESETVYSTKKSEWICPFCL